MNKHSFVVNRNLGNVEQRATSNKQRATTTFPSGTDKRRTTNDGYRKYDMDLAFVVVIVVAVVGGCYKGRCGASSLEPLVTLARGPWPALVAHGSKGRWTLFWTGDTPRWEVGKE
jgi:hypothetical protein